MAADWAGRGAEKRKRGGAIRLVEKQRPRQLIHHPATHQLSSMPSKCERFEEEDESDNRQNSSPLACFAISVSLEINIIRNELNT